jgi:hypothetical protein
LHYRNRRGRGVLNEVAFGAAAPNRVQRVLLRAPFPKSVTDNGVTTFSLFSNPSDSIVH